MKILKQINNLKIRWNPTYKKYQVLTSDKKVLEEFGAFSWAEQFCFETTDFIIYKKRGIKGLK